MTKDLFDDDFRLDDDGNVYEPTPWAGEYKPKWDFWHQRTVQDNSDRESQSDAWYKDEGEGNDEVVRRLYPRRTTSSSSSDERSGDGGGALAILVLLALFWGIRWLVRDGKKSLANASRSWGIVSLLLFPPVFFLAIITGNNAIKEIEENGGPEEQRSIAKAGIIMGYISGFVCVIAALVAVINLALSLFNQ